MVKFPKTICLLEKNINTWSYLKNGLDCWTRSGADFECKVECPYNNRKTEGDCHAAVCEDALEYIKELESDLAKAKTEVAKEIFEWIDNCASNLNFFTGNFEINLGMYLDFKKRYEDVRTCVKEKEKEKECNDDD